MLVLGTPSAASLCFAEYEELKKLLPKMVTFEPSWEELELYKDGGVAIIDQWICSHARYPPADPAGHGECSGDHSRWP